MPDIPVVVLGAGGVGKSCLAIQYIQGHFVDQHDATIEDVYRKTVTVDGTPAMLTVVDTAGQDAFSAMRDQYLRKGHGFVLVYSITDAESFQHVKRTYASLQRARDGRRVPCVLVGNKADQSAYRVVPYEKGAQLASEMKAAFLEVSARDHMQCQAVFERLVRTVRSGCAVTAAENSSAASSGTAAAHRVGSGDAAATAGTAATKEERSVDGNGGVSVKARKKHKHRKCVVM